MQDTDPKEVVAYIWRCGDECCCWQPRVERLEPDPRYPGILRSRKLLWEGEYRTVYDRTDETDAEDQRALAEAAWWFGARLVDESEPQP